MNREKTKRRWEDFNPGSYNYPPDGWKEIREDEFSVAFFHYTIDRIDYRQLYLDPINSREMHNAKLFWLYDEPLGLAMVKTYENMQYGIKYYKFGTEESWKDFVNEFCNQFRGDNS